MKLILNTPLKGLNGRPLRFQTAQTAHTPSQLEQPVTEQLTLAHVLLRTLSQQTTDTDSQALAIYTLCQAINNNLNETPGTQIEVSDTDYATIITVIAQQPVIIKAPFLQMVTDNNPS